MTQETEVTAAGLDGMLCFDLYAASRAMTAFYRPLLGEHGLTYPQYLVLAVLWDRDDVAIKELATTLQLDHATLAPLLRRLEDRGLLTRQRDHDDARSVRVALTPAGDRLRPVFGVVQCAVAERLGLAVEDVRRLQLTLRALTERLGARG